MNKKRMVIVCLMPLLISACSTVKPWARGNLAKPTMQGAPIHQKAILDNHIYFSKEGASGGGQAAGGGCGCN
jgi:hypothetical protein